MLEWPRRLPARTPPSQGGEGGSIPLEAIVGGSSGPAGLSGDGDLRRGRCPAGSHKAGRPGSIPGPETLRAGWCSAGFHEPGSRGSNPARATDWSREEGEKGRNVPRSRSGGSCHTYYEPIGIESLSADERRSTQMEGRNQEIRRNTMSSSGSRFFDLICLLIFIYFRTTCLFIDGTRSDPRPSATDVFEACFGVDTGSHNFLAPVAQRESKTPTKSRSQVQSLPGAFGIAAMKASPSACVTRDLPSGWFAPETIRDQPGRDARRHDYFGVSGL